VDPLTEPNAAVIVVVPVATLVAAPWFIDCRSAALDELHKTEDVNTCALVSL